MTLALRPLPEDPDPALLPAVGRLRQARHRLVLPDDVEPGEVEWLAQSRFVTARWLTEPDASGDVLEPGVLRLSRHSGVAGPYAAPPGDATPGADAPSGADDGAVYDVVCPRERGDAPHPEQADADGLAAALPTGMPVREEERVLAWLVAAARRLHGSVVVDSDDGPVTLTPDPAALVDLTVYTDVWLAPEAALLTIQQVAPTAHYASTGVAWGGPPPGVAQAPLPEGVELDPEVREFVHRRAEDADIAALTSGEAPTGYAVHVDLGADGLVAVEIGGDQVVPVALRGLPWADGGAVTYAVRWFPAGDDVMVADPDAAFRAARARATAAVCALARILQAAAGGEIADDAGFLVAPEDV